VRRSRAFWCAIRLLRIGRVILKKLPCTGSWVHPGFSVFAGPPVDPSQLQSLESQARYITRPAIAMDSLKTRPDGTLVLQTPPDPRTGQTSIALDPLEWIHRNGPYPRSRTTYSTFVWGL
jgi:hypothetical protein